MTKTPLHLKLVLTWHASWVFTYVRSSFFPSYSGHPLFYPGCFFKQCPPHLCPHPRWSAILHLQLQIPPRNQFVGELIDSCIGWLCTTECYQPTTGASCSVLRGGQHRPHWHPWSVQRGRAKGYFACQISFSPCPSSLSPLLILIWKCPIAFI